MAIVFDTRNAVQRLIKGGLSETQADAVVDVTSDATSQLVPKDAWETALDRTKDELRGDHDRLRTELRGDHDRLRLEVRGDLEHAIHTLTWRMFGLGLAIAGTTIAILRLT